MVSKELSPQALQRDQITAADLLRKEPNLRHRTSPLYGSEVLADTKWGDLLGS